MRQKLFAPFLFIAAIVLTPFTASAVPIIFDFEAEATSNSVSSLTITQSGLTITVTQVNRAFRVFDPGNIVLDTSPFGNRSLIGNGLSAAQPFQINFSQAVSSVAIQAGDAVSEFGSEPDSPFLEAFSG